MLPLTRLLCAHALLAPLLLAGSLAAQNPIIRTLTGNSIQDHLGWDVGGAGDVNGDGVDDIIAGAPWDDDNGPNAGSARVVSGRDGSVLYEFHGDAPGDEFGVAVAGAGDVNKDGYADVIVGADLHFGVGTNSGMARVFSGRDGSILYTFYGTTVGERLGSDVNAAGDIDKDGYADVIVGAPWHDNGAGAEGSAQVFSGRDGSRLFVFYGDNWDDHLGQSVSRAGDVDADGYEDLIVGAPWDDNNGLKSGTVRVFSGRDGSILHEFWGAGRAHEFGWSVAYLGDINQDGHADLFVGASEDKHSGDDSGSVWVFSGLDGSVIYTIYGDSAYEYFGLSISAGDVSGDGIPDLIVGCQRDDPGASPFDNNGAVHVFSGADGSRLARFDGDSRNDYFGQSVSIVGDVNGDGFPDVVAGGPYADLGGVDSGTVRVFCGTAVPSATTFGVGCPAAQPLTLSFAGSSRFGASLDMTLSNGPAGNAGGVFAFGFASPSPPPDLGVIGMTDCRQYADFDIVLGVSLSNGSGTRSISIPGSLRFCGLRGFVQGFALDAGANALGVSASNGGRVIFAY